MMKKLRLFLLLFFCFLGVYWFPQIILGNCQVAKEDKSITKAELKQGKTLFTKTCIACHGVKGRGTVPGVPNFAKKKGPLCKPENDLLKNILEGYQSPGSLLAMPPKGGNPDLSEADAKAVLAYMKTTFLPNAE